MWSHNTFVSFTRVWAKKEGLWLLLFHRRWSATNALISPVHSNLNLNLDRRGISVIEEKRGPRKLQQVLALRHITKRRRRRDIWFFSSEPARLHLSFFGFPKSQRTCHSALCLLGFLLRLTSHNNNKTHTHTHTHLLTAAETTSNDSIHTSKHGTKLVLLLF